MATLVLAISQTDSLELAITVALRTICDATGWAVGEAWMPREAPDGQQRLERVGVWAAEDRKFAAFAAQGQGFHFLPGEGVPGLAWRDRRPVTVLQLAADGPFTRGALAKAAGITGVVAIPAVVDNDVSAVLSFYMVGLRRADSAMIEMATVVAGHLGAVIQRKVAEEAHSIAQAKLEGMVAIAVDAIIFCDESRRIALFNWGAEQIFGYTGQRDTGPVARLAAPGGTAGSACRAHRTLRKVVRHGPAYGRTVPYRRPQKEWRSLPCRSVDLALHGWRPVELYRDTARYHRSTTSGGGTAHRDRRTGPGTRCRLARPSEPVERHHHVRIGAAGHPASGRGRRRTAARDDSRVDGCDAPDHSRSPRMWQAFDAGRLSLRREAQDIESVIARAIEVMQPLAADHGVTLTCLGVASDLPDVDIDGERILQVLSNLIGNACKFTPRGGNRERRRRES